MSAATVTTKPKNGIKTKIADALRSLSFSAPPPLNRKRSLHKKSVNILDGPRADEYRNLRGKWEELRSDFDGRMKWIYRLRKEHGKQYVEEFLTWMKDQMDNSLTEFDEVTNDEFANYLETVDWMQNNVALGQVNGRLWNRYISRDPDLYLGQHKGVPLTLRLNGRALNPPESEVTTCESYGITSVNPHTLLGLRYKQLDEKLDPQKILFVTLGKLIRAY